MLVQNDELCKVINQKESEIDEENLRKDNEKKEGNSSGRRKGF